VKQLESSEADPVPRRLVFRLWVSFGCVALFFLIALAQGFVRPEYDALQQSVSALSLGRGGWVQQLNFVFVGLALLSTYPVWRRVLTGGVGASAYPAITALSGIVLVLLGFVPQDPAPGYDPEGLAASVPTAIGLVHLGLAGVLAGCSLTGLLVMARRLSGERYWRLWPIYTRATAGAVAICVIVYAISSTRASGLAGLFERLAFILPTLWAGLFLWRLDQGRPLMRRDSKRAGGQIRPGGNA
jgi:hypothetical protein